MGKKIVAITSCITGVAHTYMAAAALEGAAKELGYEIHVEKQGAAGPEDALTQAQIDAADAVVFATDRGLDESRFAGRQVLEVSAQDGIKRPAELIEDALAGRHTRMAKAAVADAASAVTEDAATGLRAIFKHVMNGVSHMLPIVVAGGILTALSFAFGIYAFQDEGSLPWALYQMGAAAGLGLMVPVLSAFIADSVAGRTGFVPGIIGGMVAITINSGFIGGMIAGLVAGYLTYYLNRWIRMPQSLQGLKPIVVLPLLATLGTGLLMFYVVGGPVAWLTEQINGLLGSMTGASTLLLGIVFGLLYIDLGGAISKVLYAFAIGLVAEGIYEPMAAVMVCGMVPPLGMALATFVRPRLWTQDEREGGKAALVLGCSYITEGAIPFATAHPLQVLPGCVIGGMVGATTSLVLGVGIQPPHGGLFLALIPGAISDVAGFLIALAAGTVVCAGVTCALMALAQRKGAKDADAAAQGGSGALAA